MLWNTQAITSNYINQVRSWTAASSVPPRGLTERSHENAVAAAVGN